jgi:uncharacterized membrane-anchored protein
MPMFLRSFLRPLLAAAALLAFVPADAADSTDKPKMTAAEFLASLKFQTGKIDLPGGIATLNLTDSFRYLSPDDANKVLVTAWGNPPGTKTLGMIVPAGTSIIADDGWGVVITYDEDGHVKDDDADSIKYDELLKEMQDGLKSANEERVKQGYPAMTLMGWAEAPSYDKSTHKFFWAKELRVDQAPQNTLNYNIRVLGRKGVLVLNAVAGMNQLGGIKQEMKHVIDFTEFTPGNRYADFDSKTDRIAEYGLAALVAGGVAAKLGFFGKLFALLLAFKKLILIGLAAIGSFFYKLFGRKSGDTAQ